MTGKYLTRTIKTTLVAVFVFQLLSTVERQVFDFLGYMWAPIIGNFFQIIAVILGLFGACQRYRSFVLVNRGRYILTMGTDSKSWWLEHGIGCNITNTSWLGASSSSSSKPPDAGRPIPPEEFVEGCVLQYYYVEVIHAAVQVLLGMAGLGVALVIIQASLDEDDTSVPANDKLEFVMIRSRSTPHPTTTTTSTTTTAINNSNDFHNLAFHSDHSDSDDDGILHRAYSPRHARPYERPPSYETSMRNAVSVSREETLAASQYYAPGQHSMSVSCEDILTANQYYASGQHSAHSTRWAAWRGRGGDQLAIGRDRGGNQGSSRNLRSGRERRKCVQGVPREGLPWVQVAPSVCQDVV
ncbi:uncharacterized protein LOC143276896 isoform X2 [Babylonia areolata]|uniref:uncharacterized protein LOC143276896 isoform X2 n=1 Tax=Babylonia areolata TaxID=304850 RepID=UPI003FD43952